MNVIGRTTSAFAFLALGLAGATGAQAYSGNPGVWTDTIEAHSAVVYKEVFAAGATAHVWVRGDGDTDLDLYVYDENENLICASETYDDRESCSFVPRWTGTFYIKVVNLGPVFNLAETGTS